MIAACLLLAATVAASSATEGGVVVAVARARIIAGQRIDTARGMVVVRSSVAPPLTHQLKGNGRMVEFE